MTALNGIANRETCFAKPEIDPPLNPLPNILGRGKVRFTGPGEGQRSQILSIVPVKTTNSILNRTLMILDDKKRVGVQHSIPDLRLPQMKCAANLHPLQRCLKIMMTIII
jgi:hypothetical protein